MVGLSILSSDGWPAHVYQERAIRHTESAISSMNAVRVEQAEIARIHSTSVKKHLNHHVRAFR